MPIHGRVIDKGWYRYGVLCSNEKEQATDTCNHMYESHRPNVSQDCWVQKTNTLRDPIFVDKTNLRLEKSGW